jgi:hypothetical protein
MLAGLAGRDRPNIIEMMVLRILRLIPPLTVCAMLAVGCRPAVTAPMESDAFVRVMVALREAERTTADSLAFDAKRREILERAGVTDSMLYGFVRAYRSETEFMSSIWDTIDARLNPVKTEDTVRSNP